jgi:hypothetical protein
MHNTQLRVWRGSHKLIWEIHEGQKSKDLAPITSELIDIPRYSMLLIRQDLAHGGASYERINVRLHMFLSPEGFEPEQGTTGLLGKVFNKLLV